MIGVIGSKWSAIKPRPEKVRQVSWWDNIEQWVNHTHRDRVHEARQAATPEQIRRWLDTGPRVGWKDGLQYDHIVSDDIPR